MSVKHSVAHQKIFKTQLPVDYIDTSLVQNTWENVSADLSGGAPAKLLYIIIEQTNNGATDEDLELEITINGTAYTWSIAAATATSGTPVYCSTTKSLTAGDFTTTYNTTARTVGAIEDVDHVIPFIADSVGLIRVRQTSDVDAVSASIEVNIVWEKLTAV